MKRLTERIANGNALLKEMFDYDLTLGCSTWCGLYNHGMCSICPVSRAFNKLADYEDAEEKNQIIKFPIPIGDSVYEIFQGIHGGSIIEWQVDGYRKTNKEYTILCHYKNDRMPYLKHELAVNRIGIDLFTSEEKAEKIKEVMNWNG